jgi:hypothetical protein
MNVRRPHPTFRRPVLELFPNLLIFSARVGCFRIALSTDSCTSQCIQGIQIQIARADPPFTQNDEHLLRGRSVCEPHDVATLDEQTGYDGEQKAN